jgi:20S proteasome alpha/beta subunit
MTIAVGLACADGVVFATDSMGMNGKVATNIPKIHQFDLFPLMLTYSGSSFVFEEILDAAAGIEASWVASGVDWQLQSDFSVKALIKKAFTPVLKAAYRTIVNPPNGRERDHGVDLMFGTWTPQSGGFIVRIYPDNASIVHHEHMSAIGYGHEYAAVAQGLLSHHFVESLSVPEAELLAHRTVSTVCDVSSGGVRPPVQIALAGASGVVRYSQDQVDAIATVVDRWKFIEQEALQQSVNPSTAPMSARQDLPTAEPEAADPA